MADKVGKVWGLGSDTTKDPGPWEGELRNMWKPTQQEALWFHGGNLHQSRHYSQFLALQLKARHGRHSDAGLRTAGGPSQGVNAEGPLAGPFHLDWTCAFQAVRRTGITRLSASPAPRPAPCRMTVPAMKPRT